ncbi:uncharacterized protein LOC129301898 [Prosopis cineraria]|uniref:uncharacterized protein LOC129301898 n=1 Tax=Prosopis cineraria TaxID=364024 RepID=UPI00240F33C7|nr:uncharacterized protein LOC129301898 [Prosopis cineraria]
MARSSGLCGYREQRKRIGGVPLLNSKKRKETLFRKCHELTVKSDARVSLVCIGPNGEIETWPNHEIVKAVLRKHREKQADEKMKNGGIKKDKHSHVSESEEKKKPTNDSAGKLSAESLMTLLRELDSKLETVDEKIKMLSTQKATHFCAGANNSESFLEVCEYRDDLSTHKIESYGQPTVSSVQPNQPTQFTEESLAVTADTDCSFMSSIGNKSLWVPQNTDNFVPNHIWEPEIELLCTCMNGAQPSTGNGRDDIGALRNYYTGSDWNHLLQW